MSSDGVCECAVCQEEIEAEPHTLECGHTFHTRCIVEWFRHGASTCPMCRAQPASEDVALQTLGSLTLRARASHLRSMARRAAAPPRLKRLVAQLRRHESLQRDARHRMTTFRREHRDTLRDLTRLRSRVYVTQMNVRRLLRLVGVFSDSEFPLPALSVTSSPTFQWTEL